mgnify:CR=1 FL=1
MWISQPYTTAPTDASCEVVTAAFALLDELHREGRTVLLITHDMDVACRAKRQLAISDGRLVSDSSFA